jgi:hypothetical protein
MEDVTGFN